MWPHAPLESTTSALLPDLPPIHVTVPSRMLRRVVISSPVTGSSSHIVEAAHDLVVILLSASFLAFPPSIIF